MLPSSFFGGPQMGFLAYLGLQPILGEVAADMEPGPVVAYVDGVKINAPAPVAHAAYMSLRELPRTLLGLEEEPTKGPVIWEGPGLNAPSHLAWCGFPPSS